MIGAALLLIGGGLVIGNACKSRPANHLTQAERDALDAENCALIAAANERPK